MSIAVRASFFGAHVNQGVAIGSTSYANVGGAGDRRRYIEVVHSGTAAGFSTGLTNDTLIDGITASGGRWTGGSVSGCSLTFDFGYQHVVDEVTWRQNTATSQGTWKWQGSNDNSSYTDIGSSFTLGSSVPQVISLTGNTTPYRYYRMLGVSGTSLGTSSGAIFECEFKISAPADAPAATVWVTGNRLADITITKSSFTIGAGALDTILDGNLANGWDGPGTAVSGHWIQFDFGSSKVVDAALVRVQINNSWGTWQWQGSADASSWTDIGGNFTWGAAAVYDGTTYNQLLLSLASNRAAYRYYRMLGVSGNFASQAVREIEFRQL